MPKKRTFDPTAETPVPSHQVYAPAVLTLPLTPAEFRLQCRRRMPVVLETWDRILANPNSSPTSLLAATAQISERAFGKAPVVEEVKQQPLLPRYVLRGVACHHQS